MSSDWRERGNPRENGGAIGGNHHPGGAKHGRAGEESLIAAALRQTNSGPHFSIRNLEWRCRACFLIANQHDDGGITRGKLVNWSFENRHVPISKGLPSHKPP